MRYYKTKRDVTELVTEFEAEFSHRSDIHKFICKKYDVKELGLLYSMTKDSIWCGSGYPDKKDYQYKISTECIDFLVNENVISDRQGQISMMYVFGKSDNGKLVDIYILSSKSMIDPKDLKH